MFNLGFCFVASADSAQRFLFLDALGRLEIRTLVNVHVTNIWFGVVRHQELRFLTLGYIHQTNTDAGSLRCIAG